MTYAYEETSEAFCKAVLMMVAIALATVSFWAPLEARAAVKDFDSNSVPEIQGMHVDDLEVQIEKFMNQLDNLSTEEMGQALEKLGEPGGNRAQRKRTIKEVAQTVKPSVVKIILPDGWQGSGFLIHEAGYVLTNRHVAVPQAPRKASKEEDVVPGPEKITPEKGRESVPDPDQNPKGKLDPLGPIRGSGLKPLEPMDEADSSPKDPLEKGAQASVIKDLMVVITHDNRKYPARLIVAHDSFDLALIKIVSDRNDWPALTFSKDTPEEIDNTAVLAIGYPKGLPISVTAGIVSGVGRASYKKGDRARYIQTDACINPGNSGGPLVDLKGEVVGVNTWIMGHSCEGLGFAIPASDAESFLKFAVGLARAGR